MTTTPPEIETPTGAKVRETFLVQPNHEPVTGLVVVELGPGMEPLRLFPEAAVNVGGQLIAQAYLVQGLPRPDSFLLRFDRYEPPTPYVAATAQPASNSPQADPSN